MWSCIKRDNRTTQKKDVSPEHEVVALYLVVALWVDACGTARDWWYVDRATPNSTMDDDRRARLAGVGCQEW
jgi:hypothetical protein